MSSSRMPLRPSPVLILFFVVGQIIGPADELPIVRKVEFQPFASATRRLLDTLKYIGAPLPADDLAAIEKTLKSTDKDAALEEIQTRLDKHCLFGVSINAESRVKVAVGPAKKELMQDSWRSFLVKVQNDAGVTAPLKAESANAQPPFAGGGIISPISVADGQRRAEEARKVKEGLRASNLQRDARTSSTRTVPRKAGVYEGPRVGQDQIENRFLDIVMYDDKPMTPALSGLNLEYRIVQINSRDAGKREAVIGFNVGQGTQDLGFRNENAVLFTCLPAVTVELEVLDDDGKPVMASFVIRDKLDRVYPPPSRRLAPDFFFHDQVYRQSGETVPLAPGEYSVTFTRGPEYVVQTKEIHVPEAASHKETFRLERWIHAASEGWRSGDHHVHAAGCAHYNSPTEGVRPDDMWRHILGEDLNVGCVLSWGPCWYVQKTFFDGKVYPKSTDDYVMRYDVEVSGFPSSHAGHLTLLNLSEDDYPGTQYIEEWPTWDLPVLKWAKEQGGVVGFAHSGWGLDVPGQDLPNYNVPPYNSIGANEYIVDVTHDAVDYISTVDTPAIHELNIWYHTLNCGFRTRVSGETDFPCIYGERVGLGRVYVKTPAGPLDYENWVMGLRDGRSYVSDGDSHLLDFRAGDLRVGEKGDADRISEMDIPTPQKVPFRVRAAARLGGKPNETIRAAQWNQKPYWSLERARIGDSNRVPVELIVNGEPVERREIEADGRIVDLSFEAPIAESSWAAVRILPSSHTNPIFIKVADKPIRANRRSAEWCLKSVDVCWEKKEPAIKASEKTAAAEAYEHARKVYREILAEMAD